MKIAVLISGSLRTFDVAWPVNERLLGLLGMEFDVYMHTWQQNLGTHHDVAKGIAPKSFFWRWRPTKFRQPVNYSPANFINKDSNAIIAIQDFVDWENDFLSFANRSKAPEGKSLINSCAMYFGMEKVAMMALESGIHYTHFLRIRSDFILSKRFQFKETKNIVMCSDAVSIDGSLISDQCFYAPYNLIDPIMFNYRFLQQKIEKEGWQSPVYASMRKGEFVLFENLYVHGLIQSNMIINRRRWGKILREIEVPDSSIKLIPHYVKLFKHNKHVFLKIVIFYSARILRKLNLTNTFKSWLKKA